MLYVPMLAGEGYLCAAALQAAILEGPLGLNLKILCPSAFMGARLSVSVSALEEFRALP